jgi:hypothetical protein
VVTERNIIIEMAGACVAGLCAAIWGLPGLVVGLGLAFALYRRAR